MAKKITTIPAIKPMFSSQTTVEGRKRRVAAYARVSTDSDEQFTSFEAQVDYYTRYIAEHSEWLFVKVYADEHVIIGTSGENFVKSRVSALVPFQFFVRASTVSFKSLNIIMEGCAYHVKNNRSMQ